MIDRKALVERHNPLITSFDKFSSLSVGNGNYAFTVDATGLQTFPSLYADGGVPLGNFSNWAWHTHPNPEMYHVDKFPRTSFPTFGGREIGFPYMAPGQITDEYKWLKFNPHKLHLGQVGFRFTLPSGEEAAADDLKEIEQMLHLWGGVIESQFSIGEAKSSVTTCCHPTQDLIAVRVKSDLIRQGRLQIAFHFPYGTWKFAGVDWGKSGQHATEIATGSSHSVHIDRKLDQDAYAFAAAWSSGSLVQDEQDNHLLLLTPSSDHDEFEFRFRFTPKSDESDLPAFEAVRASAEQHWRSFWTSGGAIELAGSKDSRALELERRIVLSQYLTAIQSSGSLPPAESGLTHNSWAGKFHLEMHWWHSVHFALWNRVDSLTNSLEWYISILDQARKLAASQGYEGARWPKCVAPDGVNGPCYIEPFLIWQQPHPIYYAELIYQIRGTQETLQKYADLVFESAAFMASFAEWDNEQLRYVLGPPVAPAQEIYDHATTMNPTFELSYWAFGLSTAVAWRKRLGLPKVEKWEHVLNHLSKLPVVDGLYVAAETAPDTFTGGSSTKDHPTMLAPLGILPGHMADRETMLRTLHEVIKVWDWDATWGWDYPLVAMTSARLGEGHLAVDTLLIDKVTNTFLPNGHNYQRKPLTVYLPGNGGLLSAVAMMAAGWKNGPETHAPGFPQDGSWEVKFEGLAKML
ncbi:glycoside hydrolase family 65 [Paenibacillus sp. CGMCC 1.16610]|uniref:Glycoside hydrolase family 65 n=1 Tax=Paenibacillus anseongense TaxID=2682845 RepID=A0ABW9UF25_9BACL|nr:MULTISPECIES: glycoside hydrolase family 65 [Paenibacillus]MBA2938549.1 glycoside hydrolase family 65 [Paenibacillus sp. CGMCC 1.16610]MVQ38742.1 glycoside hydrolase family 65 [Paenibacillus anseongense]